MGRVKGQPHCTDVGVTSCALLPAQVLQTGIHSGWRTAVHVGPHAVILLELFTAGNYADCDLRPCFQGVTASEDQLEPSELKELGPRDLSYWVASFFSDIKLLQQNLLEEDDTLRRLQKEKEVLSETVRYYSAAAALKSAFGPSGEGAKVSDKDDKESA